MGKIYLKDAIFHGKTFCCCLPVCQVVNTHSIKLHDHITFRFVLALFLCLWVLLCELFPTVAIFTNVQFLGILFGGLLSILLWFEVSGMWIFLS